MKRMRSSSPPVAVNTTTTLKPYSPHTASLDQPQIPENESTFSLNPPIHSAAIAAAQSDDFHTEYGGTANPNEGLIGNTGDGSDATSIDGLMGPALSASLDKLKYDQRRKWCKIAGTLVFLASVILFLVFMLTPHRSHGCSVATVPTCDLLCTGIILQTMQFSGLFADSKTFVDMPLVNNPQCVMDDFNSLNDYSKASLYLFLQRNFQPSCTDMTVWSPPDFQENPPFLANIRDVTLQSWASDINGLWNLLGRQLNSDVYANPDRHTLLQLRSPNMIVPGGRFCEFYYWDSYWIIQGLLVSDMYDTARGIVDNFIGMVQDYGFVPNGSRKYYLNRSQPPMLTLMVKEVYQYRPDNDWLSNLLPVLEQEYQFWMEPGTHAVNVTDSSGKVHILNRYYSNSTRPRPESYVADQLTAWLLHNMTQAEIMSQHLNQHLRPLNLNHLGLKNANDAKKYQSTAAFESQAHYRPHPTGVPVHTFAEDVHATPPPPPIPDFDNDTSIQELFSELTAGAESGWDFSSRWFHDRTNLTSVETMNLIPVDLNSILYVVEHELAGFWAILGDTAKSVTYQTAAAARVIAIDAILWNANNSQWQDYHVDQKYWKSEVMISNFIPLWANSYNTTLVDEASVVSALLQSGLVMDGGIVTTLCNNTQQWDFPNAWAPLQWMIISGINSSTWKSTSNYENFQVYNSTELPPGAEPPPHACDIVYPETWYNCTTDNDADCVWCFPDGKDLSQAFALRWLLGNWVAYNRTGYMLEKYYAPKLGSPGAGGEYQLQKGFGWTNGVALYYLNQFANHTALNLTHLLEKPFPYQEMAAYVDTTPMVPEHPPSTISTRPIAKSYPLKSKQQHVDTEGTQ